MSLGNPDACILLRPRAIVERDDGHPHGEVDTHMNGRYDTDTTVYKALRIYRNALIAYVRGRLKPVFGDRLDEEIRSLFQKEWGDIERSAKHSAETGIVDRQPADALDHLSVNHACVLIEKYWPYLCPGEDPKSETARKQRTQVTSWSRELTAARNPVAHPPEENLSLRDALRYVDSAARILAVLRLQEAAELRDIWSALVAERASETVVPPVALDTLPSREQITPEFVGRAEELADLWRWIEDSSRRIWALVGDGGKGKTTIAYEFSHQLRHVLTDFQLQGVLWLTAKRRRFLDGEVAQAPVTDFFDLESALNWILHALGWDEDVLQDVDAKSRRCLELLDAFPMLIVADDIDSLDTEDEQAIEFFVHHVPQTRSKVLITSRRKPFGLGASTTEVTGLSEDEVRELVRRRSASLGLDLIDISARRIREVRNITDGSPLYIEDLLRLAQFYSLDHALNQWAGRDGDSAREYSLRRELEKLSKEARNVLAVLAYSDVPLSMQECAVVAGMKEDRAIAAMNELRNWNLLAKPGFVEDVPRYTCSRNLAKLMKKTLAGSDQEQRVWNGIKGLRGVGLASSRTRGLIQQAVAFQQGGNQQDAERVLLQGLMDFPNSGDIHSMVGWLYSKWLPTARVADAEEHFEVAQGLGRANRHLYAHWADMELRRGEYRKAAEICERSVNTVATQDAFTWRLGGIAYTKLGILHRQSLSMEQSQDAFFRAGRFLQKAQDLSVDAEDISRVFKARYDLAQAAGDVQEVTRVREEWNERLPTDPFLEDYVSKRIAT